MAILCLGFFGSIAAQKEINITITPSDADVYKIINGAATKIGTGLINIKLEKLIPVTLEVRKEGYVTVQKTFLRKKDGSPTENIELTDRLIQLNVTPADASIYVNNVEKGRSSLIAIVPKGQSVTVDVKKPGFVSQSKIYYNKEGQESPEISHLFKLDDRIISIHTIPLDADIYVDDKKKEEGSAEIIIPKDKCVIVRIDKLGYASKEWRYCNKDNENLPKELSV